MAVALLVVALVALASLFATATRTNQGSRYTTSTAILAEQKMEQLRGLAWGFDMLGLPLTDLTTNVAAFTATGACAAAGGGAAVGLSPSPGGSLATSTDGYVDYVDINGCGLGGGTAMSWLPRRIWYGVARLRRSMLQRRESTARPLARTHFPISSSAVLFGTNV